MTNLEKKNKAFHIALNELLLKHEAYIYPAPNDLGIGVSDYKKNKALTSMHEAPYGVGYIGGEDYPFVQVYKLRYTKKKLKA